MSQPNRNLQRNAADPQQVRRAERKALEDSDREAALFKSVLSTPAGRELLWRMLGWQSPDASTYDHSGSAMYFKEGRRSFTLEIKAKAIAADEEGYLLMEREQRARQRLLLNENAGINTTSAEVEPEENDDES